MTALSRERGAAGFNEATVTPGQALAFVRKHGIVLESAMGSVPALVPAIAGGEIRGSWWSHPRAQEIFTITRAVRASDQVLVCRLVANKVTLVHRRLWPALVRCSDRFRRSQLSRLGERHTPSGKHVSESLPFPGWVPAEVAARARRMSEQAALTMLRAAGAAGCL